VKLLSVRPSELSAPSLHKNCSLFYCTLNVRCII